MSKRCTPLPLKETLKSNRIDACLLFNQVEDGKRGGRRGERNEDNLNGAESDWFFLLQASTEALGQKCGGWGRNSRILVGRKEAEGRGEVWRGGKKWRPQAGTRGTARVRACSPTNEPSQAAVLSATNGPRAVTNVPRAYPVPLATNDPRVATRGTRAAAVVSATKGDIFRLLENPLPLSLLFSYSFPLSLSLSSSYFSSLLFQVLKYFEYSSI